MKRNAQIIFSLVKKDMLIEYRSKHIVTSVIVFSLTVMVIFAFSFELARFMARENAGGILWVAFAFAGILCLTRSFSLEHETKTIKALLLSPIPRNLIYLGKVISNFIVLLGIEAVLLPILIAFLNLELDFNFGLLVATIAAGSLGYVSVGTFIAAISANTRLRELLLPILLFPILIPLLIAVVKLTNLILASGRTEDMVAWFGLLILYDLMYITLCLFIFDYVVEG